MLSQGEVTMRPWDPRAVRQPWTSAEKTKTNKKKRSAEELGARNGNSGIWIIRFGDGVAGRPVCRKQK